MELNCFCGIQPRALCILYFISELCLVPQLLFKQIMLTISMEVKFCQEMVQPRSLRTIKSCVEGSIDEQVISRDFSYKTLCPHQTLNHRSPQLIVMELTSLLTDVLWSWSTPVFMELLKILVCSGGLFLFVLFCFQQFHRSFTMGPVQLCETD